MAQLKAYEFEYEYSIKAEHPIEEDGRRVVGWVFDSKGKALDKLGKLVDKHPMCHFDVCKSVKWPDDEEA